MRFIAAISLSLVLPHAAGSSSSTQGETMVEELVYLPTSSEVLTSGYKLAVVAMPSPPTIPTVSGPAPSILSGDCFLSVRAVVGADHPEDSFAMVSIEGESRVIHQGDSLTYGARTYRIQSIKNNKIELLAAAHTVRCDLREREGQ